MFYKTAYDLFYKKKFMYHITIADRVKIPFLSPY